MKYLLYYSAILAFLIGSISCKKDNQLNPVPVADPVVPSEELKSYGLFQPGSYWIYKNINNNTLDSVYVISVKSFSNSNGFFQIEFGLNDTLPIGHHPFKRFLLLKDKEAEEIHVDGPRLFRVDTTHLVNQTEYDISENNSIGPVLLHNQNYGTCRKVRSVTPNYHAASQTYFDHVFEVLWKPHIGIIKIVQSGHASLGSWELIRYHVIQ